MRVIDGILLKTAFVLSILFLTGVVLSSCDRARGTWDCIKIEKRLC